jgi:hypothetical protein
MNIVITYLHKGKDEYIPLINHAFESAKKYGYRTIMVGNVDCGDVFIPFGESEEPLLMNWILAAQLEYLKSEHFNENTVIFSPDALINKPLDEIFDKLGGGGANSGSVQMQWGRLSSVQAHKQIQSLQQSYQKINYSLSRQQTLTNHHSLLLSLQGQHATQALDSSEKLYIGGSSSVRAYPVSEQGGDRGQVLTAEWRLRLHSGFVLTAFADAGRVVTLPFANLAQQTVSLSGHGLSASWQGPRGITTRMTWAHRNGNNPKPTQGGTDSDGTLKHNRVWLSASVPF